MKILRILGGLVFIALLTVSCSTKNTEVSSVYELKDEISSTKIVEDTFDVVNANYGGEEFRFLVKEQKGGKWGSREIFVAEQNGEIINDAVYIRNITVEEKYNIKISETRLETGDVYTYDMFKKISAYIMANDDIYDILIPNLDDSSRLAQVGMLYELSDSASINIEAPWWDQSIIDSSAILGKVFYATGDINIMTNEATYVMYFNKNIISSYNLDTPYTFVNSGNWTFDKCLAMSKIFSQDLNGDGIYDDSDNNGLIFVSDGVIGFYYACGMQFASLNDMDELVLCVNSERSLAVMDMISKIYETPDTAINASAPEHSAESSKNVDHVLRAGNAFNEGRGLFLAGTLQNASRLRNMDADFGIIPMPKYDEQQIEYYTFVHTWAGNAASIPISAANAEHSAVILDATAYYAMKNITPAYYETALKGKYTRDNESSFMLDIILDNRIFDLGVSYQLGKISTKFEDMVTAHKNNFASMIESSLSSANEMINEIMDGYSGNNK